MTPSLDKEAAKSLAAKVVYAGREHECPCCGSHLRTFTKFGSPPRPQAKCPACGALERHRLLHLWVHRAKPDLSGRTLHFAAEPATLELFKKPSSYYRTADLVPGYDIQADITDLQMDDNSWDLIIANHVLEHVPDDQAALRELRRVLAPGGKVLIMVPRLPGRPTEEDASASPAERLRRFGQEDHVRMYGDDLEDRLRRGGFPDLEPLRPEMFGEPEIYRYGLRAVSPNENAAFFGD